LDVKHNSLTFSYLYIGNLFHILKKVAKPEAHQTLAIVVQNNLHVLYLLYLGYNKIILIPVLKSDNRNF